MPFSWSINIAVLIVDVYGDPENGTGVLKHPAYVSSRHVITRAGKSGFSGPGKIWPGKIN